jgi:HEAT repeat protein
MFGRSFAKKISAWRRAFESGSVEQRRMVASELMSACSEQDDPHEALPLLELMLQDPDEQIGHCASFAIARCGVPALAVLERLVKDPAAHLRETACSIIGHLHIDTSSAHTAVFVALDDPVAEVRAQAAFALSRMADRTPATVDRLAAMVRDPGPKVRGWALEALRRFGGESGSRAAVVAHLPAVLSALADNEADVRKSAISVLQELELPATQMLQPVLERLRVETVDEVLQAISQLFCTLGMREDLGPHLPALLAASAENPAASALVFEICAGLGTRAMAALPQIEAAVTSTDRSSYQAVYALWEITGRAEKCIPALERLLERRWFDASRAFELLSKMTDGDRYVVPMLRHALPNSPDEAAGMICELGLKAAPLLPDLARAIEDNWDEPDWDLMWALVDALAALESSEPLAVATFAKLLTHGSPRVRCIAVQGLGEAGPAARPALEALGKLLEDDDKVVAKAARQAIREIARPAN